MPDTVEWGLKSRAVMAAVNPKSAPSASSSLCRRSLVRVSR